MSIRLFEPTSHETWQHGRALVEEYAGGLNVDLSFQDFAHEVDHLTDEYGPPGGVFLLAEENGEYLGCVGLRRFADRVGEIKRLYVRPVARGRGVGRLLAGAIVAAAKARGYRRLLLDTLSFMREAQALYVSMGFVPTTAYRFNPLPGTAFLELELDDHE
jgi:GNAT superfamily N-acetyltransferase